MSLPTARKLANAMAMGDSHVLLTIIEAQSLCRCLRVDGYSASMKTLEDEKGFLVIKQIKKRVRKPHNLINPNSSYLIRQTHRTSGLISELCLKFITERDARQACRDLNYAFPLSKHQVQQAKQLIEETEQDQDNG